MQDISTGRLDTFYDYLDSVVDAYDGLRIAVLAQIDAVGRADIPAMNENLRRQQALISRIADFELKVDMHFAQLDVQADTLTEFISQIPKEQQYRFYDVLGRFAAVAQDVAIYKEQCRALLEAKIYAVEKYLKKQGKIPGTTYGKNAIQIEEHSHMLKADV